MKNANEFSPAQKAILDAVKLIAKAVAADDDSALGTYGRYRMRHVRQHILTAAGLPTKSSYDRINPDITVDTAAIRPVHIFHHQRMATGGRGGLRMVAGS